MVSWCVNVGNLRLCPLPTNGWGVGKRLGCKLPWLCANDEFRKASLDKLFSATTFSDFSNTFHSLIVLSTRHAKEEEEDVSIEGNQRLPKRTHHLYSAESERHSVVGTIWSCWSSLQSPVTWDSQTLVRDSEILYETCIRIPFSMCGPGCHEHVVTDLSLRKKAYSQIHSSQTIPLYRPCLPSPSNHQYDQTLPLI